MTWQQISPVSISPSPDESSWHWEGARSHFSNLPVITTNIWLGHAAAAAAAAAPAPMSLLDRPAVCRAWLRTSQTMQSAASCSWATIAGGKKPLPLWRYAAQCSEALLVTAGLTCDLQPLFRLWNLPSYDQIAQTAEEGLGTLILSGCKHVHLWCTEPAWWASTSWWGVKAGCISDCGIGCADAVYTVDKAQQVSLNLASLQASGRDMFWCCDCHVSHTAMSEERIQCQGIVAKCQCDNYHVGCRASLSGCRLPVQHFCTPMLRHGTPGKLTRSGP